jgi:hypothetical protein
MTREPSLDAPVLADKLNEFSALSLIRMVQPAASIHNMVFLQHTKTTSIGRSVAENKNFPAILSRMVLDNLLKPVNLFLINGNLMGCVLGITEDRGSHTNQKSLVSDLTKELRCWLSMGSQKHFQIGFICIKFINTLKIYSFRHNMDGIREFDSSIFHRKNHQTLLTMVSSNDFVRNAERSQELSRQFVTFSGAGEQLVSLVGTNRFRLPQISQRNESHIVSCVSFLVFFEDIQPLVSAGFIIFHVSRINVKISKDTDTELIGSCVVFEFGACFQGTMKTDRGRGSRDKGIGRRREKKNGKQ